MMMRIFTIKNVDIKGYASPEGSWALNERLAKGRTESLKKYVQELYKFAPDMITTSYEPEDWNGLRRYVEDSKLESKKAILDIIDSKQIEHCSILYHSHYFSGLI